MYELIILSLLMRGATHGYVIAGVINDVIGPFARASNSRIYPLLARLEDQGLISMHEEATSEGGRVSRAFSITSAGRVRFRELMLDQSSSPREYRDTFAFKVTALDQLDREDRIQILEHYIEFARAHVRHLTREGNDLAGSTSYGHSEAQRAQFSSVFNHLVALWQREADWATGMLDGERAARKTTKPAQARRSPR
jgi:DNA-binding PadR family transcriptional regulator